MSENQVNVDELIEMLNKVKGGGWNDHIILAQALVYIINRVRPSEDHVDDLPLTLLKVNTDALSGITE